MRPVSLVTRGATSITHADLGFAPSWSHCPRVRLEGQIVEV